MPNVTFVEIDPPIQREMSATQQMAEKVKEQVDALIQRYLQLQTEKQIIEQKLGELSNLLKQNQETQASLEKEIEMLKMTGSAVAPENAKDNEALKGKITELVKEIDRCIALLNR